MSSLFYINYKYNNNSYAIRYLITSLSYLCSFIIFMIMLNNNYNIHIIFRIFSMFDLITTLINFSIYYFKLNIWFISHEDNHHNNVVITNSQNRNLLIHEGEDFECLICYDTSNKFYNIPCTIDNHIICETCSKNNLFNLRKCPWCNIQVNIIYKE